MNQLIKKIEQAERIALVGHIRPDGDCVGSCLGLYNYIIDNYPGKKTDVYLQEIPESFRFLRGADLILHETGNTSYDLAISLDCGDTDRHGELSACYQTAADTVCIDHHRSNQGFGDFFYCDPDASSACEILCRFLDHEKIGKCAAEALYLGIVHDTGVFKYPATTEDTMRIAGMLMSKGLDSQFIIDETFYKVTYKQNRLTGQALLNAKLYCDGKAISTCITREMFDAFDCSKQETEGIVDKLRVTEGVELAVFIYHVKEDRYKYSLRSVKEIDVSTIACNFGGGGHIRAAGFDYCGDPEDILSQVLSLAEEQWKQMGK